MSPDEFEQKLQRQPLRAAPEAWRGEILAAARASRLTPHASGIGDYNLLELVFTWLRPARLAWATMAAAWVVILGLNLAVRETASSRMAAIPPPAQMREAMKQKQLLLAELGGRAERPVIKRPKAIVPGPRSDRREDWGMG